MATVGFVTPIAAAILAANLSVSRLKTYFKVIFHSTLAAYMATAV